MCLMSTVSAIESCPEGRTMLPWSPLCSVQSFTAYMKERSRKISESDSCFYTGPSGGPHLYYCCIRQMEAFPVHFPTLGCFTQFYHLHSSYYYLPSSWLSFGSPPRQQAPQGSDCHTEESKSEKGKQILYINAYTWTLKKPVWSYLQSRNRDTDIENKFMGAKGEGEWDELGDGD